MKLNQFTSFSNLFIIVIIYSFFFSLFCDVAVNYQLSIQDPATDCLEWMAYFYDLLMADLVLIIIVIFFLISVLLIDPVHHKDSNTYFSHSQNLEIFWTIVPALILLSIAYPSFNLLYSLDDLTDPLLTIKIIGHQWYWSYEFLGLDSKAYDFDSYMVPTDELTVGEFRLLTTDTRLLLPVHTPIKLLITSADVLHCWAVPSFGIKVDACPGRLNETFLLAQRPGLYFGQCSEICGVNHGFMPIMVRIISMNDWLKKFDSEAIIKTFELEGGSLSSQESSESVELATEPVLVIESESELINELKSEPKSELINESKFEPESESINESKSEPKSESINESKSESELLLKVESELKSFSTKK